MTLLQRILTGKHKYVVKNKYMNKMHKSCWKINPTMSNYFLRGFKVTASSII